MPPLQPDPQALYDAGKKTVDASGALDNALQALLGALGGSSGMCGDDPAGIGVAQAYDKAAKALVLALVDTINGSARIGDGCQASAANYANAHHASSMGPSTATPLQFPTPTAPKSAKIPPSAQGGQDVPGWQRTLEMMSGIFGPNGDPGKLQAAAGAWKGMAEACHSASAALTGPRDTAQSQGVPELEKMGTAFVVSITSLDTAAAQCSTIAEKLEAQAGQINSVRGAIRDLAARLGAPESVLQSGVDWLRGKGAGVLRQVLHDLDVIVTGFRNELSSLAHLLEPLVQQAKEFADAMAGYADKALQEVEDLVYNVAAETVNTAATWLYAAATHPGDVLLVAGGLALAEAGMGGEVGGVALDATGIGAVVGIPAAVVSAAAIGAGVTAAGGGFADLGQAASKHQVTVMEARTSNPGHFNGKVYGKEAEAKGIQNYKDDNPGRWVSTEKRAVRVYDPAKGKEVNTFPDGFARKPDGTYEAVEVKSGPGSRLSTNQELHQEQLEALKAQVQSGKPTYATIVNEDGEVETIKITSFREVRVPSEGPRR